MAVVPLKKPKSPHANATSFRKGHAKLGGRAKGTANRTTSNLRQAILDNGGQRLDQLAAQIDQLAERRDDRRSRTGEYERLLAICKLPIAQTAAEFSANQQAIRESTATATARKEALEGERHEAEF